MDSILALNHKPVIQAVVVVLVSFRSSSSSRPGHLRIVLPEDTLLLEHNDTGNYTNNEEEGCNNANRCATAIT